MNTYISLTWKDGYNFLLRLKNKVGLPRQEREYRTGKFIPGIPKVLKSNWALLFAFSWVRSGYILPPVCSSFIFSSKYFQEVHHAL